MTRHYRSFAVFVVTVLALAGFAPLAAAKPAPSTGPLALVYRGPAACDGCPESVAAALKSAPTRFRVEYVGPDDTPITPETLARGAVFAQPGGPALSTAWRAMQPYAAMLRDWIFAGGRYLGFCVGGYLAGATPGYNILPGDTSQYSAKSGASINNTASQRSTVSWRGEESTLYFQDPPAFELVPDHGATILATYTGGEVAALVSDYGAGRVGVTGPHVEAGKGWFTGDGLDPEGAVRIDLAHDLIETTFANSPSAEIDPPITAEPTPPLPPAAPIVDEQLRSPLS